MSYANYHIDNNSPNRLYEVFLNFLRHFSSILSKRYWKTGLVVWFNNKLYHWHLQSEGLKSVVTKFDKETALKKHGPISKELRNYRSLYSKLEQINFLNNSDTEELIEGIVSNYYAAEATLRNIGYSNVEKNHNDEPLKEFASKLSLGSLPA